MGIDIIELLNVLPDTQKREIAALPETKKLVEDAKTTAEESSDIPESTSPENTTIETNEESKKEEETTVAVIDETFKNEVKALKAKNDELAALLKENKKSDLEQRKSYALQLKSVAEQKLALKDELEPEEVQKQKEYLTYAENELKTVDLEYKKWKFDKDEELQKATEVLEKAWKIEHDSAVHDFVAKRDWWTTDSAKRTEAIAAEAKLRKEDPDLFKYPVLFYKKLDDILSKPVENKKEIKEEQPKEDVVKKKTAKRTQYLSEVDNTSGGAEAALDNVSSLVVDVLKEMNNSTRDKGLGEVSVKEYLNMRSRG